MLLPKSLEEGSPEVVFTSRVAANKGLGKKNIRSVESKESSEEEDDGEVMC